MRAMAIDLVCSERLPPLHRCCCCVQVFSGAAEHTPFTKTWQAGLAYSSGISNGEGIGMLRYYADHCPSITQTAQFVTATVRSEIAQLQEAYDEGGQVCVVPLTMEALHSAFPNPTPNERLPRPH